VTQLSYPKAPITEAVIEIKFASPLDLDDIEKVSGKYLSYYPKRQNVQTLNVTVNLPGKQPDALTTNTDRKIGHRLSSVDMTEMLLMWESAFIISQLAPYPGWEFFYGRFVRDWAVWKRVMGFREISRIGVRYVNRIDIPIEGPIVEYEKFLNVYPKLPFEVVAAYAIQAVMPIEEIGCKVTLNSAAIPSPILGHASYLFDQDIAIENDPPQSDDALFDLLGKIRIHKNKVFEACITDRARELFTR